MSLRLSVLAVRGGKAVEINDYGQVVHRRFQVVLLKWFGSYGLPVPKRTFLQPKEGFFAPKQTF
ncbi:hypothetical protein CJ201_02670 [Corynebacterium aurimucosum]|nr:hypothetical protein CJ201_02670 [Corynebacterium aurimucosum]